MTPTNRIRALAAALLAAALLAPTGTGLAQEPTAPNAEPGTNDELFDRTDLGNVTQQSQNLYHSGVRALKRGDKLAEKAVAESDPAKRAKLEEKAQKAWGEAAAQLLESLRLSSTTFGAYASLGAAYRRLGEDAKALSVHAAALKTDPDDDENFRGWAESMLALDLLGDATRAYDAFVESKPGHAATLLEVMRAWVETRRADPGGLDPADVERLAAWIEERASAG